MEKSTPACGIFYDFTLPLFAQRFKEMIFSTTQVTPASLLWTFTFQKRIMGKLEIFRGSRPFIITLMEMRRLSGFGTSEDRYRRL